MINLIKKLQELTSLIKAIKGPDKTGLLPTIPPIQPIKAPGLSAPASSGATIPGINPGSKKDPVKVAEQLKGAKMQKLNMPVIKADKNGQWSLDAPKPSQKYHIHIGGQQVTSHPMDTQQINNRFGSIKAVESSGHVLVPAKD